MADKDARLNDELERMRALIEAHSGPDGEDEKRPSRRNLMKFAGAALAGAAGAAVLGAVPAEAAVSYVQLGAYNSEGSAGETFIGGNVNTFAFGASNYNTGSYAGGIYGGSGGTHAAIRGAAYSGLDLEAGNAYYSTFIHGFKYSGSGRIGQINRTDVSAVAPNWTPSAQIGEHVRGVNGELWVSRTSGTTKAAWRRINSLRVDKTDGTGGVFVPVRVVDSRASQGSIGGQTGPFAAGSYKAWQIAGSNGIPSNAVAVVGNVQAVAPSGSFPSGGYLTLFPTGLPSLPSVANLIYLAGMGYLSNFFICGLGTGTNAGKLSVYIGGNSADVVIDIFGYIE